MNKNIRILVASDTHGKQANLENVLKHECFDAFIFCGDGEGLENSLSFICGCPSIISMVRGNNDYNPGLVNDAVFELENVKVFVTHGHRYRLYEGFDALGLAVRMSNCNVCCFGHTHRPFLSKIGDVLFLNPGSLSEPRQEGHIPSYAVMIKDNDVLTVEIRNAKTYEIMNDLYLSLNI